MQPFDIFIANVPYDDKNGNKVRPALVIQVKNNLVRVFKVTSRDKEKSQNIKKLYYRIDEWKKAGLNKQSYVDTHKTYELSGKAIFSREPIGKLTDHDAIGLYSFIQNNGK